MTVWDLTSTEVLPCKTISQKNFEIDSIAVFGSLLASIEYGPGKNSRDAFQVQIYDMSNYAKYSHNDSNSLYKYSLGEEKNSP